LKAELFYLDSGNALQGDINLTGVNVEYFPNENFLISPLLGFYTAG